MSLEIKGEEGHNRKKNSDGVYPQLQKYDSIHTYCLRSEPSQDIVDWAHLLSSFAILSLRGVII